MLQFAPSTPAVEGFMQRATVAICALILVMGFVLAPPIAATEPKLEGTWTAIKAERDGKPADEVVGNRLILRGKRFQIHSDGGKHLYAGGVRVDSRAQPASIDFKHQVGALKGKAWKGIYVLDGGRLTICDNAPNTAKHRPAAFEAKTGSGYVLISFQRATP